MKHSYKGLGPVMRGEQFYIKGKLVSREEMDRYIQTLPLDKQDEICWGFHEQKMKHYFPRGHLQHNAEWKRKSEPKKASSSIAGTLIKIILFAVALWGIAWLVT